MRNIEKTDSFNHSIVVADKGFSVWTPKIMWGSWAVGLRG